MPDLLENPHVMISYDNSARCSPGIPPNSLLRYKFYCGQMVGREGYENHQCLSCDGRCGPDNGVVLVTNSTELSTPYSWLRVTNRLYQAGGRGTQRAAPTSSQEVEWNPLLLENVLHKNGDHIVEQLKSASSCVSLELVTLQLLDALRRRKVELENENPLDLSQCMVCYDRKKCIAFIPCGHCCLCEHCLSSVLNAKSDSCPVCRIPVREHIKIFF
eukprot:scaffold2028_cov181-Ochromonas_danica.AAC.33